MFFSVASFRQSYLSVDDNCFSLRWGCDWPLNEFMFFIRLQRYKLRYSCSGIVLFVHYRTDTLAWSIFFVPLWHWLYANRCCIQMYLKCDSFSFENEFSRWICIKSVLVDLSQNHCLNHWVPDSWPTSGFPKSCQNLGEGRMWSTKTYRKKIRSSTKTWACQNVGRCQNQ